MACGTSSWKSLDRSQHSLPAEACLQKQADQMQLDAGMPAEIRVVWQESQQVQDRRNECVERERQQEGLSRLTILAGICCTSH